MKNLKQVYNKYVIVIGILIVIALLITGIIMSNKNNNVNEQLDSKNELVVSEDYTSNEDSIDFNEYTNVTE